MQHMALAGGVAAGFSPAGWAWNAPRMRKQSNVKMITALTELGLTTNLKLCLDAGDASSYTSGQTWTDVSANGFDFYRGSDATTETTDPTFNGVAGGRSSKENFTFDGGDRFVQTAGSAPAWVNNMHKDNALFTVLTWANLTGTGPEGLLGTSTLSNPPGFNISRSTPGALLVGAYDAGGATIRTFATDDLIEANKWQFLGITLNEPGGAGNSYANIGESFKTANGAYTAPAATDAPGKLTLGVKSIAGTHPLNAGSKIAAMMIWEGTCLTQTQIRSIYHRTRTRFGV